MRIVAGSARGRRIDAPTGIDTRPTLDRVKESLFGIIQFDIQDENVLDLFAGSGNLGIEALSRGANSAFFVDNNRVCADLIRKNVDLCGFTGKANVLCMDYARAIDSFSAQGRAFGIVFLDPPYRLGLLPDTVTQIATKGLLTENGLVICEYSAEMELSIAADELGLEVMTERKYGIAAISIFRKTSRRGEEQV